MGISRGRFTSTVITTRWSRSRCAPDSSVEYQVHLDGELRWPAPDSPFPPSRIRTLPSEGSVRVAWGSCRVTAPHEAPYTLDEEQDPLGVGVDALHVLARRLAQPDSSALPALLLLIGDQVYADDVSPQTKRYIQATRAAASAPQDEVLDFSEYTMLYREAWSQPSIRWLLSTVPSAMIFDDHDVHDDWNTSESWVDEMRATSWWSERITAAIATYWIYQHLGNLAPRESPTTRSTPRSCPATTRPRCFASLRPRPTGRPVAGCGASRANLPVRAWS